MAISQGLMAAPQGRKAAGRNLPWSTQREHSSADTLTSDFWPPELEETKFRWFEAPRLWERGVGSSRRLSEELPGSAPDGS